MQIIHPWFKPMTPAARWRMVFVLVCLGMVFLIPNSIANILGIVGLFGILIWRLFRRQPFKIVE